jgi:hypothetical protein
VGQEDLVDLRYLPGLEGLASTIEADLKAAMERAAAEKNLHTAQEEFDALQKEVDQETSPIKILQAVKRLGTLQDKLAAMPAPDGLTDKRNKLRDAVSGLITSGQTRALDSVRI